MKSTLATYSLYDLSNAHFCKVTLVTKDKRELKGQFVQFKVVKDTEFEFLYPAEKYCFLPEEKQRTFWTAYAANNGEFKDLPGYILQFGLNDIHSIFIEPLMSV